MLSFFRISPVLSLLLAVVPAVRAQAPAIVANGVVNAADYTAEIAPGAFFSIFGSNLASANTVAPSTSLPDALGSVLGVDVIDGSTTLSAPLWFVSPGQINAQMPFGIASASVQVRVRTTAGASNAVSATIVPRAPRFFTKDASGRNEAILLHLDYTLVSQSAPALPGEILTGYMNGLGPVTPALKAGLPGVSAAPLNTADPVQVAIGNKPAQASLFAGMAPGFLVYQVNFQIPIDAPAGQQAVVVTAGSAQSRSDVFVWVGQGFRTVQADVPYFTCRATDYTKTPAVVFGVTCPSSTVGNLKSTTLFNGAVPLHWDQTGTAFSAQGRIPGVAATDYCDVVIAGQLDAALQTVTTARFFEKCHSEDATAGLIRDTTQDYSFANLPVAASSAGYSLLFRAAGADARKYVTDVKFNSTASRTDGSLYTTWELLQVPSAGPSDATQIGFIR